MKLFKRKLSAKQREALARLADGIECGAKLRPQAHNKLFAKIQGNPDSKPEYWSCALGAALECAVIKQGKEFVPADYDSLGLVDYDDILKMYGVTTQATMITLDIEGKEIADPDTSVDDVIYRLNDWLHWSREKIAQFLREVE